MKKAFTFAELMISLIVIAIITAILYPTIADLAPNNNEQLFRNTYKTVELIISDIVGASPTGTIPLTCIDNPAAVPIAQVTCTSDKVPYLCMEFANRLNTVNTDDAADKKDCTNGMISTTNGVRWLFKNDAANNAVNIFVDVNAANNSKAGSCDETPDDDYCDDIKDKDAIPAGYNVTGKSNTQDTFKLSVDANGKVKTYDTVATTHLRNDSSKTTTKKSGGDT